MKYIIFISSLTLFNIVAGMVADYANRGLLGAFGSLVSDLGLLGVGVVFGLGLAVIKADRRRSEKGGDDVG